ncbi:hypothetical protein CWE08_00930 [Aliidiomarina iranensis]|uniref:Uncharacterized protein n=1 Tax=Aliidiomarina iranensis TaxID=1434071 RepID=A0A432W235_9GAMM|nr:hypothetical protein [Aliidiomarina iranensis]RUO23248.1 hypothetical protein CWE08_00930 [Aliidiomarina iranensis]
MRLKLLFLIVCVLSGCAVERVGGEEYVVSTVRYGEGVISPASASITEGERAILTLTPAAGWQLDRAEGCNGELVGQEYTTGRIRADCTVRVWFEENTAYTMSVAFTDFNGKLINVSLVSSDPQSFGSESTGGESSGGESTSGESIGSESLPREGVGH